MSSVTATGHLLIVIPFPEPKEAIADLRAKHPQLKITYIVCTPSVNWEDDAGVPKDIWEDVTILCTLTNLPSDIAKAPKLELIYVISAGIDHINKHHIFTSTQVPIFTGNGIHGPTIGEWVAMIVLVGSRRYNMMRDWQLQRTWNKPEERNLVFSEIEDSFGKRFGILGYGSIGRQAARHAQNMGMEVVVCTSQPRETPESRRDHGYFIPGTGDPDGSIPSEWHSGASTDDRAALHRFLARDLDYLLICLPLTETTRGIIGKAELEILGRKNAFLLNVARGEVVDQDAVISSLHAFASGGRGLRAYGTDVAVPEPLPEDHPMWTAPNCIITPHLSGISRKYGERAMGLLDVNIDRHLKGERLLNLVDRGSGYSSKQG